ncbi:MAG TPA: LacI family DNA-binding transcriptional regulator, partial [Chthoniobacterales bacterium]|nr:LacI family DNA-binding transcriptional regulator [Chthoniobacterales bacterium]
MKPRFGPSRSRPASRDRAVARRRRQPDALPRRVRAQSQNATLDDVAARCGVSYQTVSRVVNGSPLVAEKTRVKVLKAIADLNYRPNLAARR